jgi:hypothetical protein
MIRIASLVIQALTAMRAVTENRGMPATRTQRERREHREREQRERDKEIGLTEMPIHSVSQSLTNFQHHPSSVIHLSVLGLHVLGIHVAKILNSKHK